MKYLLMFLCLFMIGCNRIMCHTKSPDSMTENELKLCTSPFMVVPR